MPRSQSARTSISRWVQRSLLHHQLLFRSASEVHSGSGMSGPSSPRHFFFFYPLPCSSCWFLRIEGRTKESGDGGCVWVTGTQKPSLRVQLCLSVPSSKQILKRGPFASRSYHLEGSSEPHVTIHVGRSPCNDHLAVLSALQWSSPHRCHQSHLPLKADRAEVDLYRLSVSSQLCSLPWGSSCYS